MPNPTSTNHYLPEFYLSAFTAEDGHVCRTFLGPHGRLVESRPTPKTTGFEEDLYTFYDTGPTFPVPKPDYVEADVLRRVDNDGAVVFHKILAGDLSNVTKDDWRTWAAFVSSLLERHPARIERRNNLAVQRVMEITAKLKSVFGPPQSGHVDIFTLFDVERLAVNLHLGHLARLLGDGDALDHLAEFHAVKINCASEHLQFATGDNAVVLERDEDEKASAYTLALNPSTVLYGYRTSERPSPQSLATVALMHTPKVLAQSRYMFSRNPLKNAGVFEVRSWATELLEPVPWRRS